MHMRRFWLLAAWFLAAFRLVSAGEAAWPQGMGSVPMADATLPGGLATAGEPVIDENELETNAPAERSGSSENTANPERDRRYVPAAEKTASPDSASPPDASEADSSSEPDAKEGFSNACRPPDDRVSVPKTLSALRKQMGTAFRVARRGPFLIAADLSEAEFATLVDGVIACCRQCLARDYFRARPKKVVTIYVFKDRTSYAAHLRLLFRMSPISPYGHYGYSQRYIVVNYDTGPGTLVHEMTHALMAPDFPNAPIWISEGLASLYEQCRVAGESLRGDPNWRLPELQSALEQGEVTPLADLFAMEVGAFRAKRESLHYAESRYFCKFMEERGVLRKAYRAFRDRHDEDPTGRRFVEEAFGLKLDLIEKEWHAWLRNQSWP